MKKGVVLLRFDCKYELLINKTNYEEKFTTRI